MKGTKKTTIIIKEKGYVKTILIDKYGNQFIGEAQCSDGDIFDANFGSKLSYLRAKRLMGVTMRNVLSEVADEYLTAYDKVVVDSINYAEVADVAKEQIAELYKETFSA